MHRSRRNRWWWWCLGGIATASQSPDGQYLFALLTTIGITLDEWRDLDPRDSVFYSAAFSEQNRQKNKTRR